MRKKKDLATQQEIMKQRQAMQWQGNGRPPKFVDAELVYRYASEGASDKEIAARAGVAVETLHCHFTDLLDRARARFIIPLRIKLVELAFKGHWPALRLCLELYAEFPNQRGERKVLTEKAQERDLLRFFSRLRNA